MRDEGPEVPGRLRSLLDVGSGLDDGPALPVVPVLLSVLDHDEVPVAELATEPALGVALGIVVPAAAVPLIRSRSTSATPLYASLGGLALGLMVLGPASQMHADLFLAAVTAGITIATIAPDVEHSSTGFGELVTELLKLAAILVLGALTSPAFLSEIPPSGYLFAVPALVLARPVAIFVSLLRSHLPLAERAVAAWFGPKGFASVVYGLLVLEAGIPLAGEMFHLVALVIFASILAHSSTDVPIAHAFAEAMRRRSGDVRAPDPARPLGAGTPQEER